MIEDEIYKTNRLTIPKVLEDDTYKGYRYIILTLGTHPCAYIIIPKNHPLFGLEYKTIEKNYDICCHGGLTYTRNYLGRDGNIISENDNVWVIGWDYNHYQDWSNMFSPAENHALGNKKHTLNGVHNEVLDVINQINENII